MNEVKSMAVIVDGPSVAAPLIVLKSETMQQIDSLVIAADSLEVNDEFGRMAADDLFTKIRALEAGIEKQRTEIKAPVLKLSQAIDAAVKQPALTLATARKNLGERILAYQREQERLRREAEEKARREQAAAEAKRKAEEQARMAQEAELRKKGMPIPPPAPAPVVQPVRPIPVPPPVTKSSAVTTAKQKVLVIVDKRQIPWEIGGVELLVPDEAAIKRLLTAGVSVPGCRIEEREILRSK